MRRTRKTTSLGTISTRPPHQIAYLKRGQLVHLPFVMCPPFGQRGFRLLFELRFFGRKLHESCLGGGMFLLESTEAALLGGSSYRRSLERRFQFRDTGQQATVPRGGRRRVRGGSGGGRVSGGRRRKPPP